MRHAGLSASAELPVSTRAEHAEHNIILPVLSVYPMLCLNDCTYHQTFSTIW